MATGKILVIRGGAVGDFILTLPAVRLLVENLPEAELEILGYESIISLAVAGGYAKRTRSIEYRALASFFSPGGELDEELCGYFAGFSVVVSYLYDPDHFFRDNLVRAGVDTLIECSHRIDNAGPPASKQLAKPLESLDLFLEPDRAAPQLRISQAYVGQAEALLGNGANTVAIHPGSGSPYKNWDLNRWKEVIMRLNESSPDQRFLISTGEAEEETMSHFLEALGQTDLPIIQANRLPLPVLGAALAQCRLYLGHDSGISHLAAAVGTPSILLFGPTRSSVWAPPHEHVTVMEHPSGLLSEISVEEVVEKVIHHLQP